MATLYVESDFPYKNLYRRHRRSDSGELDVFDATSYFSGEEMLCQADPLDTGRLSQKIASEERGLFGGGDKSLDEDDSTNPTSHCQIEKSDKKSNRKSKSRNPVSPGSKLATILNALLTPVTGKKKPQPNQTSHASANDGEYQIPCGRMKRRSSMSYAQTISDSTARSVISDSGFNCLHSPSLNSSIWKETNGFSYSKVRSVALFPSATPLYERRCTNIAWLDQKFLFSDAAYENFNYSVKNKDGYRLQKEKGGGKDGDDSVYKNFSYSVKNRGGYLRKENDGGKYAELIDEPIKKNGNIEKEWRNICQEERTNQRKKEMKWVDECSEEEAAKKAKEGMEDGFESDSSSDLFELQKL